jgi:uncharacterized protein (TIGR00255 family)
MKSMTGFGKSKISANNIDVDIEIKSVNSRFLDMRVFLPRDLNFYEFEIRRIVGLSLKRGAVDIRVNVNDHREPKVRLNEVKLKKYYEIVNKAVNILNLDQKIGVEFLLNEPGVIENANNLEEDEDLKVLLDSAISQALVKIDESMSTEGEGIQTVLVESMEQISLAVGSIEGTLEDYRSDLFSSMNKRISELLTNHKMDNMEQRLVQELAIYIDKYDVQEEITRLHSHIETFRNTIKQGDNSDIGKTLNFIVQEMLREANTLGSKYSTSQSFKYILSIKEEIEKCREIVQNVS